MKGNIREVRLAVAIWCLALGALCVAGCATEKSEVKDETPKLEAPNAKPPTPDQKAEAIRREARRFENRRQVKPGHEKKLREALAVEGISPKERQLIVEDLVRKVFMNGDLTAYAKAQALVNPILAEPATTNKADRMAYTFLLADAAFRSVQPDEAKRLVDGLWQLPDLRADDTNAIFKARVGIDLKLKDYAAARAAYRRVFSDPKESARRRFDCLRACVPLWSEDQLWDEGLAELAKWDIAREPNRFEIVSLECRLLREKGDYDGVVRRVDALVAVCEKMPRLKAQAQETRLAEILRNDLDRNDLEQAMTDLRAGIEIYRNVKYGPLGGLVINARSNVASVRRLAETRHDWAKVAEISEMKLGYSFRDGWKWDHRYFFLGYINALAHLGRGREIPAVVDRIFAATTIKEAVDRACFRLVADYYRAGKVDEGTVRGDLESLKPAQKLSALARTAKFFVALGDRETALAFYDIRQSLLFTRPQNRAKVAYVKDAPVDVGGWFASGLTAKLEKHVVDVPFDSDEAARLILDVSVQREVAKTGGESETYFYVCWDERGVHLLFVGMDPEWRKVLEGSVGGTGYEMYLRFGEGAPTYQWLVDDQVKGKTDYIDYASPGKAYRPLQDHLIQYSAPIEGGFATVMNISWSACYERLPQNGTTWPFEMIHWSRGGGVTWGGETIWETSRWGRWEFADLTPERVTAIKRALLNGAVARFKAQERVGAGEITTWKDREIGDPEFYEKALKPLVDKLAADAKLLTPEADAETVARLYDEDMGPMYDFKYYADAIREKYLRTRLTEK